MKKIILTIIVAVMLFGSCKKNKINYQIDLTFSTYGNVKGEVINYWLDKKQQKQFVTQSTSGSQKVPINMATGDKFYFKMKSTDNSTTCYISLSTGALGKAMMKSDKGEVVFEGKWE